MYKRRQWNTLNGPTVAADVILLIRLLKYPAVNDPPLIKETPDSAFCLRFSDNSLFIAFPFYSTS